MAPSTYDFRVSAPESEAVGWLHGRAEKSGEVVSADLTGACFTVLWRGGVIPESDAPASMKFSVRQARENVSLVTVTVDTEAASPLDLIRDFAGPLGARMSDLKPAGAKPSRAEIQADKLDAERVRGVEKSAIRRRRLAVGAVAVVLAVGAVAVVPSLWSDLNRSTPYTPADQPTPTAAPEAKCVDSWNVSTPPGHATALGGMRHLDTASVSVGFSTGDTPGSLALGASRHSCVVMVDSPDDYVAFQYIVARRGYELLWGGDPSQVGSMNWNASMDHQGRITLTGR